MAILNIYQLRNHLMTNLNFSNEYQYVRNSFLSSLYCAWLMILGSSIIFYPIPSPNPRVTLRPYV